MVNPYGQIQKKKFKLTNQLVKLKTFDLFSLVRVSDGKQRPVPLPYFLLQLAPVGHVLQGVNMGGMPLAEVGEVLLPREMVDRGVRIRYGHVGAEFTAPLHWLWAFDLPVGACLIFVKLELITPACVDLHSAAARGEVESVVPDGYDAPQSAYGDDGVGLADGADEVLRVEIVLALAPGGEGPPLPADGLLVGHDA